VAGALVAPARLGRHHLHHRVRAADDVRPRAGVVVLAYG
jgi:hypothetical protein